MLEIKPVREEALAKSLFGKKGFEYDNNCICVVASDKEEIFGECFIRLEGDEVYIMHLAPENDIMMFDGMLRSALHIGIQNGARKAFYENTECEENYEIIGFISDKANKSLNIDKLYSSCCGCNDK